MSGIEIAGNVLAIVPLIIGVVKTSNEIRRAVRPTRRPVRIAKEYGWVTSILLHALFRDALSIMDKVEKFVVHADDQQVMAFIKAYSASFNMIGVAGAIIAQVAITALSLSRLEDSHWTTEAFFVSSLVTGALSVFFSCAVSPAFHGLHTADQVKTFLTKPARNSQEMKLRKEFSDLNKPSATPEAMAELREKILQERWKIASAQSAIMLVVPMTLLNLALNAFLIGLGIYLGKLYTAKLVPSYGEGSMGIMIFFLVSAVVGIGAFYIPRSLKQQEHHLSIELLEMVDDLEKLALLREDIEGHRGDRRANGAGGSQNPSQSLSQSVHERRGGKIRFTVGNDTIQRGKDEIESDYSAVMRLIGRDDLLPSSKRHGQKFPERSLDVVGGSEEASPAPQLRSNSIQSALMDLAKAQEQSLEASRRILEALDLMSEENIARPS